MLDRRSVLRRGAGAIGTATLAGLAGCAIGGNGGGDGNSGSTFLSTLPDSTPALVPSFHAAYSYDPGTVSTSLGGTAAMSELAGQMVDVIGQLQGTALEDVDRLSGQTVRQVGHSGGDVAVVSPSGTDLVVQGSIDAQGAANWLAAQGSLSALGDDRGYRRYGDGGSVPEGFAVDADAFTFGSREATNVGPDAITTAAIDALEDDAVPASSSSPELLATVEVLPGRTATAATQFDLVAERPDTGTDAYDATAASLIAAGIDARIGETETDVVRVLRYRRDRRAGVETVQSAVDAATAARHFHDGAWSVRWSERTVRIEGTVPTASLREDPAPLRRAVPVPAYDDLAAPVDPRQLGRGAPPRVNWQAEVVDDAIRVTHGGGPGVTDLELAYEVDGERIYQRWEPPVESGDTVTTDRAPAAGTLLDLVWARGTVDETILVRIRVPESGG